MGIVFPDPMDRQRIPWQSQTPTFKEGANAKLKSDDGMTACDYAKINSKVRGTDVYLELKKATF
jgi:hypothetical protein